MLDLVLAFIAILIILYIIWRGLERPSVERPASPSYVDEALGGASRDLARMEEASPSRETEPLGLPLERLREYGVPSYAINRLKETDIRTIADIPLDRDVLMSYKGIGRKSAGYIIEAVRKIRQE